MSLGNLQWKVSDQKPRESYERPCIHGVCRRRVTFSMYTRYLAWRHWSSRSVFILCSSSVTKTFPVIKKKEKGKAIPVTGHGGRQGCETSRLPYFLDTRLTDGDKVVSLTRRPPFNPQKDSRISFLLEAESTPGPQCGWKDQINLKFQWPHRESNPRPSGLYHSASTNYATACPVIYQQLKLIMHCWQLGKS
jgi:hypothetical protein